MPRFKIATDNPPPEGEPMAYTRDASLFARPSRNGVVFFHAQHPADCHYAACSTLIPLNLDNTGMKLAKVPEYSMCRRGACRKAWEAAQTKEG